MSAIQRLCSLEEALPPRIREADLLVQDFLLELGMHRQELLLVLVELLLQLLQLVPRLNSCVGLQVPSLSVSLHHHSISPPVHQTILFFCPSSWRLSFVFGPAGPGAGCGGRGQRAPHDAAAVAGGPDFRPKSLILRRTLFIELYRNCRKSEIIPGCLIINVMTLLISNKMK